MEESNKFLEEELIDEERPIDWAADEIENARNVLWNTFGNKLLKMAAEITTELGIGNTFEIFSTNLNTINNWTAKRTYVCPLKTMFLKDSRDMDSGIGFIFNMITPDILFVGTIGTAYLNRVKGLGLSNTYWEINLVDLDDESLYASLKEMLKNYIITKYNIKRD